MNSEQLGQLVAGLDADNKYQKITRAIQLDEAGEFLKKVKGRIKEVEQARLTITRPLDESKKLTMELFKPYIERLENMLNSVTGAIKEYQQEQIALNAKREAQAVLEGNAPNSIVPFKTKAYNLTERPVWKFKVVDESLIPREFLCPDLTKIGKFARTLQGDCKIDGVEVYSEKVMY